MSHEGDPHNTFPDAQSAPPADPPVTVGRVVHYHTLVADQHEAHAATVVKVWSPTCANLACLDGNGHGYTVYSASKGGPEQPGTWSYPVRA